MIVGTGLVSTVDCVCWCYYVVFLLMVVTTVYWFSWSCVIGLSAHAVCLWFTIIIVLCWSLCITVLYCTVLMVLPVVPHTIYSQSVI